MIEVGDSASLTKTFTENDVLTFAEISGDQNPVHVDAEFAATTRFERQLVHGILTAGMISAVLGMQLPGPGCIYLKQELNFRAPVYFGDTVECRWTFSEIDDRGRIRAHVEFANQEGDVVLDAVITGILPSKNDINVMKRMTAEGDPTNKLAGSSRIR